MQPTPISVRVSIWLWLIGAMLVGKYELLTRLPLPAVQLVIFVLTALLITAYFKLSGLRSWINQLDLRALVLLHVTRFVGIYFLILNSRGILPREFALPAGIGDIVVAALALVVAFLPIKPAARNRAINIWNMIGFVDILLVLVTAGRLGFQGETRMVALTVLPLSLLPTFLVPLILFTHFVIYLRIPRELPE